MMEKIAAQKARIDVVDALRGFAVLAIVLVHNLEHFIFPVYPENQPAWLAALDQGVFNAVFTLFAGKAYAIFSLLFTVVGLVLFLVRHWSDRAVLILAVFFLLQPVEWFHYIASLVNPAHHLPDLKVGEMYAQVAEVTKSGTFWDFILCNITLGQKASLLWAVNAGRFFQTAGLFLLGFWLGRKRRFADNTGNREFWVRTLAVSAVLFAPLYTLNELIMQGPEIVRQTAGTAFDMWQKLAFTFVLVSSFVLLYRNAGFSRAVSGLRFYGRMSLTNYITQSVIGALVYFPFGLYFAPHCGYTLSLLIGIAVFILQLLFCRWWLSRHRQGPLEYIWHKWTWIGSER